MDLIHTCYSEFSQRRNYMDLVKYRKLLFKNIKFILEKWFDSEEHKEISNHEVYRFLHSIKGTAGTLELNGLLQKSEQLLQMLDLDDEKLWDQMDLQNFLSDLIELTYECENFEELIEIEQVIHEGQAPLIQIIDDDVSMLMLLKDILEEQGWIVMTHTDPDKAVKHYFEMQPDCLILDICLSQKDGFQVLEDIRLHNEKYFTPVIMISINNDKQSRIKAYKLGADDFVSKPIDMEEFVVKLNRHLQRKKIFDQSVLIDELTKVYNRRFLEEDLPRYFQEFKRTGQTFTIGMLDLDYFKKVNDTYGHSMGDQVLVEFAQYIRSHIRGTDTIYRYGGEEFSIVFPKTTSEEAKCRLNQLIEDFSRKVFNFKDMHFSVTFSAGIYAVENEMVTMAEALRSADEALYEAKRIGRSRVESLNLTLLPTKKKKLNISVIDDDVLVRTILSQILQSLKINHFDVNIEVFENGPAFFDSEQAKEDVNHFLILDGVMPIMDGIEVLQKVKQGKNAYQYTVLMLTGRKSEDEIARALNLGADDYVTKPFSVTELQARIERLLKRVK